MTDPVEKERQKYRLQKMADQWARGRRWAFWLPIGLFFAIYVAIMILGKQG